MPHLECIEPQVTPTINVWQRLTHQHVI
jgi:hypothetical protein